MSGNGLFHYTRSSKTAAMCTSQLFMLCSDTSISQGHSDAFVWHWMIKKIHNKLSPTPISLLPECDIVHKVQDTPVNYKTMLMYM